MKMLPIRFKKSEKWGILKATKYTTAIRIVRIKIDDDSVLKRLLDLLE